MMKPTIHMNGTSRSELERQLCEACVAVLKAKHALVDAAPNGRDYYLQGDDAFTRANNEHVERLRKLDEVGRELTDLLEWVAG